MFGAELSCLPVLVCVLFLEAYIASGANMFKTLTLLYQKHLHTDEIRILKIIIQCLRK